MEDIVCLLCYSYRVSRKVGVLTQPQRGGHLSLCVSPKLVNQGALEYITHGCRLLTNANEWIPTSMCGLSFFWKLTFAIVPISIRNRKGMHFEMYISRNFEFCMCKFLRNFSQYSISLSFGRHKSSQCSQIEIWISPNCPTVQLIG